MVPGAHGETEIELERVCMCACVRVLDVLGTEPEEKINFT